MDAWRILGVERGAPKEEVRSAYLRLAKQLHPDINPTPAATEMMRIVNLAFEELKGETYQPPPYRAPAYQPPPYRPPPSQGADPCEWIVTFGKYKGERLLDVWKTDPNYINWCVNTFEKTKESYRQIIGLLTHQRGGIWDLPPKKKPTEDDSW